MAIDEGQLGEMLGRSVTDAEASVYASRCSEALTSTCSAATTTWGSQ